MRRIFFVSMILMAAICSPGSGAMAGKIGAEFQVNTFTTLYQRVASVAGLAGGGFVVIWESVDQDGSEYGIYGQRFNANGKARGDEFRVNTYTSDNQSNADVASLASGGFVVVWNSEDQDGSSYGIYGQRFNAKGKPKGGEFKVNTYTSSHQRFPSVAGLSGGGYVVTWESNGQDGSGYGVYAKRFNAKGVPKGSDFRVNTYTANTQLDSSVDGLANGGFVVVWSSWEQDGSLQGIFGQRFNAKANSRGPEFQVNTYTTNYQSHAAVAGLAGGAFFVVWDSGGQDGSGIGVYGQMFDESGSPVGGEKKINKFMEGHQAFGSVAGRPNGSFVVLWHSFAQDGSEYGVYGQRYRSSGSRKGKEFRVNTHTSNDQMKPAVAVLSNGNYVGTWNSYDQDGNRDGIFGQRFD